MKRLFVTFTMMLIAYMANAQSCPDDNHPHAIDLGLPSATRWACCNVDTDNPENQSPTNCGGYYAWGETETKSKYDWSSYIHCDGSETTCHDLGSDIAGSEYDVAHVRWGGSWVIPSKAQIQELVSECAYNRVTRNGVDGGLFTGPNGNTVFLPATNIRWNGFLDCLVLGGYYWSSTPNPLAYGAYKLFFDSWGSSCDGSDYRGIGLPVRPVMKKANKGTNSIIHPKSSIDNTSQTVFNICGTKVADTASLSTKDIYIRNGKKFVAR
jgi:hypothetical protein